MIGIIGGSGFYSLLEGAEERKVSTPYGKPSSLMRIGKIGGKDVVFMARHGDRHDLPPHKVPFRANIWALKQVGVERIIATAACGSLKKEIMPGDFVIPDQFANFTRREDTFYDGPETVHVSFHEPYCSELRSVLLKTASANMRVHPRGTVAVIQGPRFSTRAESEFYKKFGFDIINMTQYPEVALARELEMCYSSVSIVTDYDTGLHEEQMTADFQSASAVAPVNAQDFLRIFSQNVERVKLLITDAIPLVPDDRKCGCKDALKNAKL